ncbi:hypothetical protein [Pedobacter panaciterrae]
MLKNEEKRTNVYAILSKIIGLKFHSELKDSGIELESMHRMINLVTGKENYLIVVNGQQIRFVDAYGFSLHFSMLLASNIEHYDEEYTRLTNLPYNEFADEVEIAYKQIDYYRFKQKELLEKLTEFKLKIRP